MFGNDPFTPLSGARLLSDRDGRVPLAARARCHVPAIVTAPICMELHLCLIKYRVMERRKFNNFYSSLHSSFIRT